MYVDNVLRNLMCSVFSPIQTESVVDGYEGIVQTSGFLVPGKTKGQLQLYNMNAAIPADTEINIASSDVSKKYKNNKI